MQNAAGRGLEQRKKPSQLAEDKPNMWRREICGKVERGKMCSHSHLQPPWVNERKGGEVAGFIGLVVRLSKRKEVVQHACRCNGEGDLCKRPRPDRMTSCRFEQVGRQKDVVPLVIP